MNVKCEWCNSYFDDNLTNCPNCNAPNNHIRRTSNQQPQTIEELRDWYRAQNLPPEEVTRFFIGKDIKEPKAFGIFKRPDGTCVVYKNKANGERAVRYEGTDEAYAVGELYQRLREEIVNQKQRNAQRGGIREERRSEQHSSSEYSETNNSKAGKRIRRHLIRSILLVIFFVQVFPVLMISSFTGKHSFFLYPRGYYIDKETDKVFYAEDYSFVFSKDTGEWYIYHDDTGEWSSRYGRPDELKTKEWVSDVWGEEENALHPLQSQFTDMVWYKKSHPDSVPSGYYTYNGQEYYNQYGSWYYYGGDTWQPVDAIDDELYENTDDYYDSYSYSDSQEYTDFSSSAYYKAPSTESYSSDSDSDWSSDSWDSGWSSGDTWDSGGTDWNSDW